MTFLTEKVGFHEYLGCTALLNLYFLLLAVKVNSPPPCVRSYHSPPVSPVSRDVSLFALNSTVNTTNSKAYHLLPVPHKPSVPVSLLPPLCVCVRVSVGACTHTPVNTCVCTNVCVCVIEECSVFPMSGVIFRIYLHTLLVHN